MGNNCISRLTRSGFGCRDSKAEEESESKKGDEKPKDSEGENQEADSDVQVKAPEVAKIESKLNRQQSQLVRQESKLGGQQSKLGGTQESKPQLEKQEPEIGKQETLVVEKKQDTTNVDKQQEILVVENQQLEPPIVEKNQLEPPIVENKQETLVVEKQQEPRIVEKKQEPQIVEQKQEPQIFEQKQESVLNTPKNQLDTQGSSLTQPSSGLLLQPLNLEEEERENKPVVKPRHVKNMSSTGSSAGLQVDSVLRRKTGNVKDFYTIGKKLGHGQFGTTFLCVENSTGVEYACKTISKRKLINQEDIDDVRREIEIMHHLKGDPNVIAIKDAYEDPMAVHVIMELCTGGELFDRIIQRGHYSEKKAANLARVIVSVVQSCHSLGVMHRDLKPENFLFVNQDEDSPLKTIDFGLSTFFKPGDTFTDVVGSPYYVAPEVLRKRSGPEADVWSAGVITYILLCGVPPFWAENEEDIFEEVLHGELDFTSDPWPNISDSAKDLVRRMLDRDPKTRMTAHDVLCHAWIMSDGVAPDKPLDHSVISRLKQFSAMNKLKKMALRVIAERLSEEEIAGLKQMFKMIDTDNSGHITFEELKEGLERFGANLDETEIHHLMKSADVDESGTIDYGEFITAMLQLQRIDREDHLFAAFSYFDKDGSGYITRDELQQACREFGMSESHLEDIIKEVDQDNDGRIDYNEFVVMMQRGNVDLAKKGMQKSH